MADIKISELTQVSALNNGDLVEVSQVNALAPSGYTSLKASMTDLGKKVNSDIEYTTDLADFTDKTTLGAIKETAKGKNIADEYDDTQTYDKGDVVIYKNTLYICTTNNTTGTWDATKWTATTVQSLIGSLSQLTTSVTSSLVGAVNSIYPTKDIGGTAKGVNATYQIPAGVLNHSIITIALRRYAYAGEVTILSENITAGAYTNGLTVFGAHDKYAEFSISATGLITITAISNWAEVYIDLIGIF